ncbi:MAG: hypothetical protein ABFC96_00955 [Thermoguttaceae bacterium]
MLTATCYFLGLAACLVTALACFARGRKAGRNIEIKFDDLRVASLCLASAGNRRTWRAIRVKWTNWYLQCQEVALRKREALYSWARTLALCSVLCLIGAMMEAQYDQRISVSTILAGFTHHHAMANSDGPR